MLHNYFVLSVQNGNIDILIEKVLFEIDGRLYLLF